MVETTVLYCTANRENPRFEARIRAALLAACGDCHVVSVSQELLTDCGQNICVGNVGMSDHNRCRQLLIGVQAVRTPYVALAESDTLYPSEYFAFTPPRDDTFYQPWPIYMVMALRGRSRGYIRKTRPSEGALVCSRDLLERRLRQVMADAPDMWDGGQLPRFYDQAVIPEEKFPVDVPVLSFKTDHGMHRGTPVQKKTWTRELAPFGEVHDVLERWFA